MSMPNFVMFDVIPILSCSDFLGQRLFFFSRANGAGSSGFFSLTGAGSTLTAPGHTERLFVLLKQRNNCNESSYLKLLKIFSASSLKVTLSFLILLYYSPAFSLDFYYLFFDYITLILTNIVCYSFLFFLFLFFFFSP